MNADEHHQQELEHREWEFLTPDQRAMWNRAPAVEAECKQILSEIKNVSKSNQTKI